MNGSRTVSLSVVLVFVLSLSLSSSPACTHRYISQRHIQILAPATQGEEVEEEEEEEKAKHRGQRTAAFPLDNSMGEEKWVCVEGEGTQWTGASNWVSDVARPSSIRDPHSDWHKLFSRPRMSLSVSQREHTPAWSVDRHTSCSLITLILLLFSAWCWSAGFSWWCEHRYVIIIDCSP